MAHLFNFAETDTSIFSRSDLVFQNSGKDEILEIEATYIDVDPINGYSTPTPQKSLSRSLIKFDLNNIIELISSSYISNPTFYLNLKTVQAKEIPLGYTILAYPISQSWAEGVGRKYDGYTTQGASWKFPVSFAENLWYTSSMVQRIVTNNTSLVCTSGSWSGSWAGWFTGSSQGVFIGYVSASGIFTGSFTVNTLPYTYLSGSITGSSFSGSVGGTGYVILSGSFLGSSSLNITSQSIAYTTTDTSLVDESGGGTWWIDNETGSYSLFLSSQNIPCVVPIPQPTSSAPHFSKQVDSIELAFGIEGTSHIVLSPDGYDYLQPEQTFSASSCYWNYECSQSFYNQASDIHMDVSSIVYAWIEGCIPNNGFLLMHSGEADLLDYGQLRFYSMETNTIYSPTLECSWDDSQYTPPITETVLTPVDVQFNSYVVYASNVSRAYKQNSVSRINIFSRDRYPVRSFSKTSIYNNQQYLPSESYYAVKDAETEEVWINFDHHSKISCDVSGSYFILNMSGLPQEHYYKIMIQVKHDDGQVDLFEDSNIFKIIR